MLLTRTPTHTYPPYSHFPLSPSVVTTAVILRVASQRTDDHQHREDHGDDDHGDEHIEATDVPPCDCRAGPRTKVVEVLTRTQQDSELTNWEVEVAQESYHYRYTTATRIVRNGVGGRRPRDKFRVEKQKFEG